MKLTQLWHWVARPCALFRGWTGALYMALPTGEAPACDFYMPLWHWVMAKKQLNLIAFWPSSCDVSVRLARNSFSVLFWLNAWIQVHPRESICTSPSSRALVIQHSSSQSTLEMSAVTCWITTCANGRLLIAMSALESWLLTHRQKSIWHVP